MKPSRGLNLVANYAGSAWTAVVQLALVPYYIASLGVDAYGLIGFYTTLQGILLVLDVGLSRALNRELARRVLPGTAALEARDLLRTLELIYGGLGLVLGLAIALASGPIAERFLNAADPGSVADAVAVMGLCLAAQWSVTLYEAGLLGLQRQARASLVNSAAMALFAAGVVVLLRIWSAVEVVFLWRAVVCALQVLWLRHGLWRALDAADAPEARFRLATIREIWGFSLGMTGIAVTAMVLTQIDKLVVARMLSLERLGYYMLAVSLGGAAPLLVAPIANTFLPILTQSVATNDRAEEARQFHLGSQLVAVVAQPPTLALILCAREVLLLWTGNQAVAEASAPLLSLLMLGSFFNSIMVLPYMLQVAHGWTRLAIGLNILLVLMTVPLAILATRRWDATGAAFTCTFFNSLYLLLGAPPTFRRLLSGEGGAWFVRDVLIPCCASLAVIGPLALLLPTPGGRVLLAAKLLLVLGAGFAAALLSAPAAREQIVAVGRGLWNRRGSVRGKTSG